MKACFCYGCQIISLMLDLSYGRATCLTSMFGSQIVNGPEVLSKFVGETEKNVRDLFADAENEQRTRGMVPQEKISLLFYSFVPFYFSKKSGFNSQIWL